MFKNQCLPKDVIAISELKKTILYRKANLFGPRPLMCSLQLETTQFLMNMILKFIIICFTPPIQLLWVSYIWFLGGIISAQTPTLKGEKEEDSYKKNTEFRSYTV